jgi:hypothetical protein
MTDHPGMIYEDCNGLRCTNQGVYEETVLESKGCPDARNIQENIDAGNIHVYGYPELRS